MREIKFRAWWPEDDGWTYWDIRNAQSAYDPARLIPKDVPVMQYTGLKDKNGVEIYEGDVVIQHEEPATHDFPQGRFGVAWIGNGWNLAIERAHYENGVITQVNRKYEVIGNIYENPELLNE